MLVASVLYIRMRSRAQSTPQADCTWSRCSRDASGVSLFAYSHFRHEYVQRRYDYDQTVNFTL
jgi:hypothetical protein